MMSTHATLDSASTPPSIQAKKVSVLMITYNHERFIAQAIESALMQVADFDFEIVIGEDCSTDGTREIVADFVRRHPEKIRPLFHDVNVGANRNFSLCLDVSQGQYVALLEGDDYWTDPQKLQKQVTYLDSHPDVAVCFHDVQVVYDNNHKAPHPLHARGMKEVWTLGELLNVCFIRTCSAMLRRDMIGPLPEQFYTSYVGDWPLFAFAAQHGMIGFLDEIMSSYRFHDTGIWSTLSHLRQQQIEIDALEMITKNLRPSYRHLSREPLKYRFYYVAWEHATMGNYAAARKYAWRYIRARVAALDVLDRSFVRLPVRVYAPSLFWIVRTALQYWPTKRLGTRP